MIHFSKPYLLADYAEWQIVSGARSEVSKGDLMVEANVNHGLAGDQDGSGPDDPQLAHSARRDTQLDDCFDHLGYRERAIGRAYLFSVKNDVLVAREEPPNEDQTLVYTYLLACGSTEAKQLASSAFSELCKEALSRMLGSRGTVYNIDAGSDDRTQIGTDTREMARFLAPVLGCSVIPTHVDQLSGQGDGGADLAASVHFGDGATGHFSILGQCAASNREDYWRDKLAQPRRLESLFIWSHAPVSAAFVPFLYRSSNGSWISQANVSGSVFFDRLRILNALQLDQVALPEKLRRRLREAIAEVKNPAPRPKPRRQRGRVKKRGSSR